MSVLATIEDIKIPYPTEGIIRTAQIDDTVTPENSVQLAVNMNFDRVGAIQTRLGVTQYADDLVAAINNFGTLRNSVLPHGFDFIFEFGGNEQIVGAPFAYPSAVKITETKIAIFWQGAGTTGVCRNFSIDQETGTISPLGLPVTFEATQNAYNKAILTTADVVVNLWQGVGNVAKSCAFNVAADTIVVGTPYQFDSAGYEFGLAVVDVGSTSHVIVFYAVTSGAGLADILAINSAALTITEPGATLTFASGGAVLYNSAVGIDSTHYLNVWSDLGAYKAQAFLVNTGTWAITTIGTVLTGVASSSRHNLIKFDTYRVADVYTKDGVWLACRALEVNSGTFAVTFIGTPLGDTVFSTGDLTAAKFDNSHFAAFYSFGAGVGFARLIQMDGSFNMTFVGNVLSGYDYGSPFIATAITIASSVSGPTDLILLVWGNLDTAVGTAAFFSPYGNVVNGRWLYAGSGTSVYNTPGTVWTSRRGGLATVSKPRFSQFLNYIWMVNGNAMIGGDPVATSKGGAFGNDLIPDNFPPGDFIHAGFEGRVWVANKTIGVIYYTDIVQFIPPATYILTYNSSVNFISAISPQTGQSITALYRVPRALLVFTEDSIFRIYGATSIDAYPAYNVGTFSQESIIETKTGIFFHHSSGFYQFDYGSQPVEISRRIIDFVKAIPRSYYENVTGVYDGFDCVEWSVGPVTVEGVAYTNCMVRYTISTQVWTIYDYVNNAIKAMVYYDDGVNLNHLMGTSLGKTGAIDTGYTDFGEPFYFEFIDRWRSFTKMYYQTKNISGFSVYSENAAGANLSYQVQKSGANAWKPLGTVTEKNNSLNPNDGTDDFDVLRLRLAGNTKGAQVVVHGIEITELTIKGQDEN